METRIGSVTETESTATTAAAETERRRRTRRRRWRRWESCRARVGKVRHCWGVGKRRARACVSWLPAALLVINCRSPMTGNGSVAFPSTADASSLTGHRCRRRRRQENNIMKWIHRPLRENFPSIPTVAGCLFFCKFLHKFLTIFFSFDTSISSEMDPLVEFNPS